MKTASKLPYFSINSLVGLENNRNNLKITLSRFAKKGKLVRLKKGLYIAKTKLDEIKLAGSLGAYSEAIASRLYSPSYLSLEYVLYEHNLLTELPINFTSVTTNKTSHLKNSFGNYYYHSIKENLLCGFDVIKKNGFDILKASKTKALFDYLYFRKNILLNKETVDELRLNTENLSARDIKELKKYCSLDDTKKMKAIFNHIFK